MANKQEDAPPIYQTVNFDPNTLTIEDIAFIVLCRRMKFGTISDVAINNGRPTVLKTVVQRLDLTVTREGIVAAKGEVDLLNEKGTEQDLVNDLT